MSERGRVEHLNPDELPLNPAFTQVVTVTGPVKTVFVGGQNAVTASEDIVGRGNIGAQTEQIFRNLSSALSAAGAGLEHVVKWHINVVEGQPIQPAFEVFRREWGDRPDPPVITVAFVSGLAHPDFLVELDAMAVVPA
jgi:enamine deaminase RidA (YjgF/YER057c/UK114 family)